jgi:hypothetical protein
MAQIKKGDTLAIPDAPEPLVASRDEYNSRVYVMTAREYEMQSRPGGPRGKEEPYLVLPDRTLVRDYQHGFPDEKG